MSNDTTDDFRQKLKKFAEEKVLKNMSCCDNESKTRQFLVEPFLKFLGYDSSNPHDSIVLSPEESTGFCGKKSGRIDYKILRDKKPVIAIECKKQRDIDLGGKATSQLYGYFANIHQSELSTDVLIGVLTNGVTYEFFTDTQKYNVMDSTPFTKFDFKEIAQGKIDEFVLEGLSFLQKSTLEPEKLRTKAVKRRFIQKVAQQIEELFQEPSEEFVHFLVEGQKAEGEQVIAQLIEKEVKDDEAPFLVQKALTDFLKKEKLCRTQLAEASLVSGNSEEDEANPFTSTEEGNLLGVQVDGCEHRSIGDVFNQWGFSVPEHVRFRKEVKKKGSGSYKDKNGEERYFELNEAIALKRLVSQGLCSVGTLVFDKDHCYQAKITDRGTLQTLDEQEGVPSSLAGQLLKKTSYGIRKAWDFWRVNYEGQEISLSDLRAIAAESLKKI
ncbi:MAG: type I restriction enzyme HsdR N-terminal domain-containing protein [Acetobacter sp.]|nr:type I restriction enzyme HsdR N-terminal domain-containing protein [Acetobacter sp.]